METLAKLVDLLQVLLFVVKIYKSTNSIFKIRTTNVELKNTN